MLNGNLSLENEAKRAVAALVKGHSPTRSYANSVCKIVNLARVAAPLTTQETLEESKAVRTTEVKLHPQQY